MPRLTRPDACRTDFIGISGWIEQMINARPPNADAIARQFELPGPCTNLVYVPSTARWPGTSIHTGRSPAELKDKSDA